MIVEAYFGVITGMRDETGDVQILFCAFSLGDIMLPCEAVVSLVILLITGLGIVNISEEIYIKIVNYYNLK